MEYRIVGGAIGRDKKVKKKLGKYVLPGVGKYDISGSLT